MKENCVSNIELLGCSLNGNQYTFAEWRKVIVQEIEKRRERWGTVYQAPKISFEELSKKIQDQLEKKWHYWDQNKSLLPWINRTISLYCIAFGKKY